MSKKNQNQKSSVFIQNKSEFNTLINLREHRPGRKFSLYGDAFYNAGIVLFEQNFKFGTKHSYDAIPVVYLFRHALELYLKSILYTGNENLSAAGKETVKIENIHSVSKLFKQAETIFKHFGWNGDAEIEGFREYIDFEKCINDLERDNTLGFDDVNSVVWRYPLKTDGKDTLQKDCWFNVLSFVEKIDKLLHILGGWANGLCEDYYDDYEDCYQ